MKSSKLLPDYNQLQLTNDVVKCNSCKKQYAVQVALDLKNIRTRCPWCERVQDYDLSPLAPKGGTDLTIK